MTSVPQQSGRWPSEGEASVEQLARRQGIAPVDDVRKLAYPDAWSSEEEFEEFLTDLYASRKRD